MVLDKVKNLDNLKKFKYNFFPTLFFSWGLRVNYTNN